MILPIITTAQMPFKWSADSRSLLKLLERSPDNQGQFIPRLVLKLTLIPSQDIPNPQQLNYNYNSIKRHFVHKTLPIQFGPNNDKVVFNRLSKRKKKKIDYLKYTLN